MNSISIVIAVLDSPEVVRRQIRHFVGMPLRDNVELVLVDDGSDPALQVSHSWVRVFRRERTVGWTQPAARNYGVSQARGEYVICTDIDHILCQPLLDTVSTTEFDAVKFTRDVAVLDEQGQFTQDRDELERWGYRKNRGLHVSCHTNSFAMRRDLYLEIGGVSERYVGTGQYPNREEVPMWKAIKAKVRAGEIRVLNENAGTNGDPRPRIYMMPNGRYVGDGSDNDADPLGLFHKLRRKK